MMVLFKILPVLFIRLVKFRSVIENKWKILSIEIKESES